MSGDSKAVADPDNVPPQSRLFIVVPKTSDGTLIEVTFDAEAEKPSLFHSQEHSLWATLQKSEFVDAYETPFSNASLIPQAEMASFDDLEYCKTDLIAAKGIVFCKYSKTSSALKALESVQQSGLVSSQYSLSHDSLYPSLHIPLSQSHSIYVTKQNPHV